MQVEITNRFVTMRLCKEIEQEQICVKLEKKKKKLKKHLTGWR